MAGSINKADHAAICEMYNSDHSSVEIAEKCGFSPTHVRRILRKNGVTIRSLSEAMSISHARPEVKAKFSAASTGRKHTEAAKEKLRRQVGPENANWRNGLTLSAGGYLCFTSSPANGAHAGKPVHTVIAEWKYKRSVEKGEHVHHVDGNKLNNSPDNLEIMLASDHARYHAIKTGLGKNA